MTTASKSVLVTGANGYLGRALTKAMTAEGHRVTALVHKSATGSQIACDLADMAEVRDLAAGMAPPDIILHCAGSKDVSMLERDPAAARRINVGLLAHLAAAWDPMPRIVLMSSDYIFDGRHGPYAEAARPCPDTRYGWSKHLAERFMRRFCAEGVIVRLSGAYDAEGAFPRTIMRHHDESRVLDCYINAVYSPVYLPDFTKAVGTIIRREARGLFHLSGLPTTRFDFARTLAIARWGDASFIQPAVADEAALFFKRNLALGHARAERELDYRPTPLKASFEDMEAMEHAVHQTV
jgi:dTDP-4-dehydrorhamnose reductase